MGILSSGLIRNRIGEKHMINRGIIENKKIGYTLRIPKTKEIAELLGLEIAGQFLNF